MHMPKSVISLVIASPIVVTAWTQVVRLKGKAGFQLHDSKTDVYLPKGRLVHLPGLFESLSSLPIHNWVDPVFDDIVCRGPECDDQCEIPDDWKNTSVHVHIDVLDYLGIKRAVSLRDRKS